MNKHKKVSLYVEGQTEQILVNHFIKTWWNYSNITIQNLKLRADGNAPCKVPNFAPNVANPNFLVIDVEGVGSLPSVIAGRANQQQKLGYEIFCLRDLDYDKEFTDSVSNQIQILREKFTQALKKLECYYPDKVNLFFAIMEIDTWLLAFRKALAKWSRTTESEVSRIIDEHLNKLHIHHLELIPNPAGLRERIGRQHSNKDSKSYASLMSLMGVVAQPILVSRRALRSLASPPVCEDTR